MSDQLPSGWAEAPAGAIARIVGGGTPPSKDPVNFTYPGSGIPWITPADLSGYRKQTIERGARDLTPIGLAACGATLLPKGTVLFSSRAPIGYVAIAANEISTNQGFKSFVLPEGFDPRFTYYQLKHLKPEAEAIATGTTFKELSGAATATLPFKLSPLVEQTRIADQLDALLARVQACNHRFDAIPALLKRFRQSILTDAITGKITIDWRQANGDYDWPITTLDSICVSDRVITYGVVKLGDEVQNGTPCLRTSNVRWLHFELEGIKRISSRISQDYARTILIEKRY
jgi:type I restriction enzyme, S subunit